MPSEPRTNKNMPGELMMSGTSDAARTVFNAEVATAIKPGTFVAVAATVAADANLEARPASLPVSAASVVIGVCKKWALKDNHPPSDQMAVYHKGNVGAYVATAVKYGDPVFAIFTPGPTQGYGTNVAGANAAPVTDAMWVSSTPANEVAIVSLSKP
jgi:hypothetical protein